MNVVATEDGMFPTSDNSGPGVIPREVSIFARSGPVKLWAAMAASCAASCCSCALCCRRNESQSWIPAPIAPCGVWKGLAIYIISPSESSEAGVRLLYHTETDFLTLAMD